MSTNNLVVREHTNASNNRFNESTLISTTHTASYQDRK